MPSIHTPSYDFRSSQVVLLITDNGSSFAPPFVEADISLSISLEAANSKASLTHPEQVLKREPSSIEEANIR